MKHLIGLLADTLNCQMMVFQDRSVVIDYGKGQRDD